MCALQKNSAGRSRVPSVGCSPSMPAAIFLWSENNRVCSRNMQEARNLGQSGGVSHTQVHKGVAPGLPLWVQPREPGVLLLAAIPGVRCCPVRCSYRSGPHPTPPSGLLTGRSHSSLLGDVGASPSVLGPLHPAGPLTVGWPPARVRLPAGVQRAHGLGCCGDPAALS